MGTDVMAVATLTPGQFDLVYNMLSLGLASMAASTVFFFLRLGSFAERYKAALCFTGLVTFIAMYHYFRIFNSFPESYTPCEATVRHDNVTVINYNACNADVFGYTPPPASTASLPSPWSPSRWATPCPTSSP